MAGSQCQGSTKKEMRVLCSSWCNGVTLLSQCDGWYKVIKKPFLVTACEGEMNTDKRVLSSSLSFNQGSAMTKIFITLCSLSFAAMQHRKETHLDQGSVQSGTWNHLDALHDIHITKQTKINLISKGGFLNVSQFYSPIHQWIKYKNILQIIYIIYSSSIKYKNGTKLNIWIIQCFLNFFQSFHCKTWLF